MENNITKWLYEVMIEGYAVKNVEEKYYRGVSSS